MPEKSGMDAALCGPPAAGPTAGVCPKAGVAAANVANNRKSRALMISSASWFALLGRLATAHLARQREEDAGFLDRRNRIDADLVAFRERRDDLLDQHLRRGRPRRETEPRDRAELVPIEVGGAPQQVRGGGGGAQRD